ncbi:MAG: M28 family peptidase [Bacteroidales bacterium]
MKRNFILCFLVIATFNLLKAQNDIAFGNDIVKEDFEKEIQFLCDSSLSGRKIASTGEKTVADFIRKHFVKCGLNGVGGGNFNFYQDFTLTYDSLISFNIYNDKNNLDYISDFFTFEFSFLQDTTDLQLVYGGFGLDREDYSDYRNLDVKNKWVVVEMNSPLDSAGNLLGNFDFDDHVNLYNMTEKKLIAQKHGARGIIFKIPSHKYISDALSHVAGNPHIYGTKDNVALNLEIGTFPKILAKKEQIDLLMGLNTQELDTLICYKLRNKQSPAGNISARIAFEMKKKYIKFNSQNIIGIIPGRDKKVGIILSAHYDAVKGEDSLFFPGANDNAAGTATVLELAKGFSEISKAGYIPEKSIAFVLFSGEEEGIVGSTYFVNHIPFEVDSATLDINMDCVGILDSRFNKGGFSISAPETILDQYSNVFNQINSRGKEPLNIEFNTFYQYSDNASFTYNGLKAMNISTGGGEVIHSPRDRPELLDLDNLVHVTRLLFDFVLSEMNFAKEEVVHN